MPSADERLATVEAVLLELRADVADIKHEAVRTRDRLHKLEGVSALFVETQKENRRKEAEQYHQLGTRLTIVGLILTALLFIEPFLYHYAVGK